MSLLLLLLLLVDAYWLFSLPRRWAWVPLLVAASYFGCQAQIEIGPGHFTASRILVVVGFLRIIARGERLAGGWNALDALMVLWAVWTLCSSVFHVSGVLITRLGMMVDTLGVYLLFRIFVRTTEDLVNICKAICLLLAPLAAAMVFEKLTGRNCFEALGGCIGQTELRNGHFRARGPFLHQILSGSVGATCIPLALFLWRRKPKLAWVGLASSGAIVIASGSSGPLMSALAVVVAMGLWRGRAHLRALRWGGVMLLIGLNFVMKDPVYYLMARIDITGGSTGWHRAALIDSAFQHFDSWWATGTDFTRDWMASGIPANNYSTDITNHFLGMGVVGGLPLMFLFIWILKSGFAAVGRFISKPDVPVGEQFLIWTLGAILFGHAITFFSVSYFDQQSVVFFYLILAAIGSVCYPVAKARSLTASRPVGSTACA